MTTFSLTSFNARWGLTVDDTPFDLPAVVAGFDTDIISLQEVWEPTVGGSGLDAASAARGYHLVHVPLSPSRVDPRPEITADPAEASGTWGVVLLSRLPVRGTRIVDLGRMVERWDVADRFAILAEIAVGDATVTVAALHLSFALPNALAQVRRLRGYLPTNRPSIIVGDCNLWGPLATAALGNHRRAVRGRTWPAERPHSQLDHILVSPAVSVVGASVLPPAGSDHRPVQARLQIR
ncbi:endonuclease/exonuclease/phosphatase family protein [Aquihabitans daechungensis]|uniref:endonuclease/exonuclease/phosphatase family protein n=1 Tax=Aquihabitans daechungensis TaxID=1052257 RepID=UPI003BA1184C